MFKNAIIINGTTYQAKRMLYCPGCGCDDPCGKCDLKRKCENQDIQPCRLFSTGNRLAYFKKIKSENK